MKYQVCAFAQGTGNGDVTIKTDRGRLVALVYAQHVPSRTNDFAAVIASALNASFAPSMTDLMVDPETLSDFMQANPLPDDVYLTVTDDLRKRVMRAIFDPGATEGLKGERDLTTWQTDAVMRALVTTEGQDNA